MSYVTRVLQPGEQVVYTTKLHWLIYLPAILLVAVAMAAQPVGIFPIVRASPLQKIRL